MRSPSIAILSLTLLGLSACPAKSGSDDDVDVTTVMSESSSESMGESDTSGTSGTTTTIPTSAEGVEGVDGIDVITPSMCDVWMQDCPEGEKCVPYSSDGSQTWNEYKCVPVMGDQAPGEPCTYGGVVEATDDCDASSMCFGTQEVDGMLIGTCHAQCTGSVNEPMCPPGSTCQLSDEGVLVLCLPSCDPLAQDCPPGDGCYWVYTDFHCVVASGGGFPNGEPCGYVNDCAPGNLCADAAMLPSCAGAACCTSYCNLLEGDAGCVGQPGTVCSAFFEMGTAPAGYENVGACILPP